MTEMKSIEYKYHIFKSKSDLTPGSGSAKSGYTCQQFLIFVVGMMKRNILIVLLSVSLIIGSCNAVNRNPAPNILWILAEDLSPDLGCYGNEYVFTPNIDGLAREGKRFLNVFATGPACTPSRTALATGMYQISLDAHHMRYPEDLKNPLPRGIFPMNELLRKNGYQTVNVKGRNTEEIGTGKTDWSFRSEKAAYDLASWDEIIPDKPFFGIVNLRLTHRPFERDLESPIDPEMIKLPPYYPDHPVCRKDWALYLETVQGLDKQVGQVLDELESRGWSENTIVIFFSDHGRPFSRAKYFLYDSGIKIPLLIYCPEQLDWTQYIPPGSVDEQLISAIDITATSLAMAGIKRPKTMQGRVFLGPERADEREYIFSAADRLGETFFKSRCVRGKRYHYIRNYHHDLSVNSSATAYRRAMHPIWHVLDIMNERGQLTPVQQSLLEPMAEEELYDVEKDPYEIHNLAANPAYREVLESMKDRLVKWQAEAMDYGMFPDPPALVEHFRQYGKSSEAQHAQRFQELKEQVEKDIKWSGQ
jgi:uncharacterized sulfatase